MLGPGSTLAERLLSFPMPVVIACTGHAVAMGAFLLLSGDYRVGAAGPYKFVANEVAIGLTMPARSGRDPPAAADAGGLQPGRDAGRAVLADNAVQAGFLDRVVSAADVHDVARASRKRLATLDMNAHLAAKLLARQQVLAVSGQPSTPTTPSSGRCSKRAATASGGRWDTVAISSAYAKGEAADAGTAGSGPASRGDHAG